MLRLHNILDFLKLHRFVATDFGFDCILCSDQKLIFLISIHLNRILLSLSPKPIIMPIGFTCLKVIKLSIDKNICWYILSTGPRTAPKMYLQCLERDSNCLPLFTECSDHFSEVNTNKGNTLSHIM